MVGLQYNYRSQINKHLRKSYKLVDANGNGSLDHQEFFMMLQFIGFYYRIYRKFHDHPNNYWALDKDEFKKHPLRKWVEGSSIEEKMLKLNRGKSDKVTFTNFIEYGTDLISRLIQKLEPTPTDDTEVKALREKVKELQGKIKELEREIQRLNNEIEALKK